MRRTNLNGILLTICILGMLLSGCAGKKAPKTQSNVNHTEPVIIVEDSTNQPEEADAGDAEQSTNQNDESEGDIVSNNHHYFVKCGDTVYFHMPKSLDTEGSALWGEFASRAEGEKVLYAYNLTNGTLEEVCTDHGAGVIAANGGKLFFSANEEYDGETHSVLAGVDLGAATKVAESVGTGEFLFGVSDDGRTMASVSYDETGDNRMICRIHAYHDGIPTGVYDASEWIEYVGISGDELFYNMEQNLIQMNLDNGQTVNLGQMPNDEFGGTLVEQFEAVGDEIYVGIGFYEGTGNFYSGGYYLRATRNQAGSLSSSPVPEDSANEEGGEFKYVPFYVAQNRMIPADGEPMTAFCDSDTGEVGYYDNRGDRVVVTKGFATEHDDSYDWMQEVELAELVDHQIYLVRNTDIHEYDDDIGWRMAYKRIRAEVYVVDITSCETTPIMDVFGSEYEKYD